MKSRKTMRIKPNDTLFFGQKRFTKGMDNAWLSTKLMPYPSVFLGAICSLLLSEDEKMRNEYINSGKKQYDPRNFVKIGRIFLYDEKNNFLYMPAPQDLFIDDDGRCHIGNFRANKDTSLPFEYILHTPPDTERVDGMYIKFNNFYNSYARNLDSIDIVDQSELSANAYKVGIEIDNRSYAAKDKHLYRLDLVELMKGYWSYVVEYEINPLNYYKPSDISDHGYLRLGGENKSCKYFVENVKQQILDMEQRLDNTKNDSRFIKLVLLTPGNIFDNFCEGCFIDDISIKGISSGELYYIGGFDMQKGEKSKYRAFKEGTVFLLESSRFKNASLGEIKCLLNKKLDKEREKGLWQFEVAPAKNIEV